MAGTLSKGFGCLGGFAAANSLLVDYLINFARPFIFATSLPPLLCASALEALKLMREEPAIRQRLWRNVQKTHEALISAGLEIGPLNSPIIPIFFGGEEAALGASQELLEQGIFVPAIRYPTVPKGKARLRVTISSLHQDGDIARLAESLKKAFSKVKKKQTF
ncbi:MAG: pyridoxal phosphate-dependent aminotransferase family protein [Candidatus Omnitrophica bacterium]|nr:pyridoxal phosphate-dependent aminotransferase family protein [Candidatus Omnitrophota bacterium]